MVERVKINANDRLVELEVERELAAMEKEDMWSAQVTKAARKAKKKAKQELWQALESLDLRDARESAKEVAKKEKEKKAISKKAKSCHKIAEFFIKRGGGGNPK